MNKKKVEEFAMQAHDKTYIVVSIASKKMNTAFIVPNTASNIKEVLFVSFNDTDMTNFELGEITKKEVKQISDFVKRYNNEENEVELIVQCEAGLSRSVGTAGAISKYLFNDDSIAFSNGKTPNRLCYRKVLEELMTD